MARGKSSGGGCLGTIIFGVIIMAVIGAIAEALPYIAVCAVIALIIWAIVKISKAMSNKRHGISGQDNISITNTNVTTEAEADSDICVEVDRQIKAMLNRRGEINDKIKGLRKDISRNNRIWNKKKEECVANRELMEEELKFLENKYAIAIYSFNQKSTPAFSRLVTSINKLRVARFKTYDNSPQLSQLVVDYIPKGDMEYIKFATDPLCLRVAGMILCLTPYYVVKFSTSGKYICTFYPKYLKCSLANGSYTERIKHVTWAHTRQDGLPDRRYSNNPQRVYYTNVPRTVWNMLAIHAAGVVYKYEIDESLKNEVMNAIRAYGNCILAKTYNQAFHVVRLIKACSLPNDDMIKRVEALLE